MQVSSALAHAARVTRPVVPHGRPVVPRVVMRPVVSRVVMRMRSLAATAPPTRGDGLDGLDGLDSLDGVRRGRRRHQGMHRGGCRCGVGRVMEHHRARSHEDETGAK